MQRTWVITPAAVVTVLATQLGSPAAVRVTPVPPSTAEHAVLHTALSPQLTTGLLEAAEAAHWQCTLPHRTGADRAARSAGTALLLTEPATPNAGTAAEEAQPKPISGFGTGSGENPRAQLKGTLAGADSVNTYAVPLRAGEVFSATVRGAGGTLEVRDPNGVLVEASGVDRSGIYPSASPLLGGGNATVDHVAAVTGTHTLTVRRAKPAATPSTRSATPSTPAESAPASPAPASGPTPTSPTRPAPTSSTPTSGPTPTSSTRPTPTSSTPAVPAPADSAPSSSSPPAESAPSSSTPATPSSAPKPPPSDGSYQADLGIFTPTNPPAQKIVLEFDGATVDTRRFGVETASNQAKLSPLRAFITRFGLRPADQPALTARIVETVRQNMSDALGGGQVEVTSADQPGTPRFGQPGVSRVVISGSSKEAGISTVGIAESVDPGNFVREETALVLLDRLGGPVTDSVALTHYLPGTIDENAKIQFVGRALGNIASHEAGHLLGSWHTDAATAKHDLMAPGDVGGAFGFGADKMGGTPDDVRTRFGQDIFDPQEGFTGTEDTRARTKVGLGGGAPTPAPSPG